MSKGIVFTDSQVKAFENGATIFIVPFNLEYKHNKEYMKKLIEAHAPIQKGEEFFIKEEFATFTFGPIRYKANEAKNDCAIWEPAIEMQENQSRYKNIKCIDISVVRVQDICNNEKYGDLLVSKFNFDLGVNMMSEYARKQAQFRMFKQFYNTQLKEQNINRKYKDNDYVFLIEIKNER